MLHGHSDDSERQDARVKTGRRVRPNGLAVAAIVGVFLGIGTSLADGYGGDVIGKLIGAGWLWAVLPVLVARQLTRGVTRSILMISLLLFVAVILYYATDLSRGVYSVAANAGWLTGPFDIGGMARDMGGWLVLGSLASLGLGPLAAGTRRRGLVALGCGVIVALIPLANALILLRSATQETSKAPAVLVLCVVSVLLVVYFFRASRLGRE